MQNKGIVKILQIHFHDFAFLSRSLFLFIFHSEKYFDLENSIVIPCHVSTSFIHFTFQTPFSTPALQFPSFSMFNVQCETLGSCSIQKRLCFDSYIRIMNVENRKKSSFPVFYPVYFVSHSKLTSVFV